MRVAVQVFEVKQPCWRDQKQSHFWKCSPQLFNRIVQRLLERAERGANCEIVCSIFQPDISDRVEIYGFYFRQRGFITDVHGRYRLILRRPIAGGYRVYKPAKRKLVVTLEIISAGTRAIKADIDRCQV